MARARDTKSTEIYLHADNKLKQRAIETTAPIRTPPGRYTPPDSLLAFLDGLLILGFTAAVIGGLDSALGAVVGGIILGVALSLLDNYVSNDIDSFFVFALLLVVLMIRPNGLFARPPARRV